MSVVNDLIAKFKSVGKPIHTGSVDITIPNDPDVLNAYHDAVTQQGYTGATFLPVKKETPAVKIDLLAKRLVDVHRASRSTFSFFDSTVEEKWFIQELTNLSISGGHSPISIKTDIVNVVLDIVQKSKLFGARLDHKWNLKRKKMQIKPVGRRFFGQQCKASACAAYSTYYTSGSPKLVGSGAFGDVALSHPKDEARPVAVKRWRHGFGKVASAIENLSPKDAATLLSGGSGDCDTTQQQQQQQDKEEKKSNVGFAGWHLANVRKQLMHENADWTRELYFYQLLTPGGVSAELIDWLKCEPNRYLVTEALPQTLSGELDTAFASSPNILSTPTIVYVTRVLATLDEYRVVHGDLHARNVMLDSKGVVKLIDFGFTTRFLDGVPSCFPIPATWGFMGGVQYPQSWAMSGFIANRFQLAFSMYYSLYKYIKHNSKDEGTARFRANLRWWDEFVRSIGIEPLVLDVAFALMNLSMIQYAKWAKSRSIQSVSIPPLLYPFPCTRIRKMFVAQKTS